MEPDEYFAFGIYTARTPRAVLADRVDSPRDQITRKRWCAPFTFYTTILNKHNLKKRLTCTIISTHWPSDAFRFCQYSMIIGSIKPINQSRTVPESAVTLRSSKQGHQHQPSCRLLPPPPTAPYKSSHLTRRPHATQLSSQKEVSRANHSRVRL